MGSFMLKALKAFLKASIVHVLWLVILSYDIWLAGISTKPVFMPMYNDASVISWI